MTSEVNALSADVLALAGTLAGGRTLSPALETLCLAAVSHWTGRLRPGLTASDCRPALLMACALTALAGQSVEEAAANGVVNSLRVGALSMTAGASADPQKRAGALRNEAERLMAPYTADIGFAFMGVDA